MFSKEERSSFSYWFAHWCAFQMTALNLHTWRFRFIFHDMEKPWLKLFWSYDKVKKFHRTHNRHHPEYDGRKDWLGMVIDWECSRFTKTAAPMNARETLESMKTRKPRWYPEMKKNIEPILNKLGL